MPKHTINKLSLPKMAGTYLLVNLMVFYSIEEIQDSSESLSFTWSSSAHTRKIIYTTFYPRDFIPQMS